MPRKRDGIEKDRAGAGLREDIVSYVRTFTRSKGTPPSVRNIYRKFYINGKVFYGIFEGIDQVCELAGVGAPRERSIKVQPALEAKQRQELEPVKENPKEAVKSALSEFEEALESSKYAAIQDPSKAAEYASMILPVRDAVLWKRIQLLDTDLGNTLWKAIVLKGPYIDLLKRAKISGEKVPDFADYMSEAVREFVTLAIRWGFYRSAPPGDTDETCHRCNSELWYSGTGATQALYCPNCDGFKFIECPVCNTRMEQLPPRMLKCGGCGYRLRFKEDLKKQILTAEDYIEQARAGKIPTKGTLYFTRRLPDGRTSYIPVMVRPGRFPGQVKTELVFDREFIQ